MFCPHCGRQNKENSGFCTYCGKSMHENTTALQTTQRPKKDSQAGLSFNAKKAIVTGVLVAVLILVVLLIYYPSIFPWN